MGFMRDKFVLYELLDLQVKLNHPALKDIDLIYLNLLRDEITSKIDVFSKKVGQDIEL